jgi:hypothetical protein
MKSFHGSVENIQQRTPQNMWFGLSPQTKPSVWTIVNRATPA